MRSIKKILHSRKKKSTNEKLKDYVNKGIWAFSALIAVSQFSINLSNFYFINFVFWAFKVEIFVVFLALIALGVVLNRSHIHEVWQRYFYVSRAGIGCMLIIVIASLSVTLISMKGPWRHAFGEVFRHPMQATKIFLDSRLEVYSPHFIDVYRNYCMFEAAKAFGGLDNSKTRSYLKAGIEFLPTMGHNKEDLENTLLYLESREKYAENLYRRSQLIRASGGFSPLSLYLLKSAYVIDGNARYLAELDPVQREYRALYDSSDKFLFECGAGTLPAAFDLDAHGRAFLIETLRLESAPEMADGQSAADWCVKTLKTRYSNSEFLVRIYSLRSGLKQRWDFAICSAVAEGCSHELDRSDVTSEGLAVVELS